MFSRKILTLTLVLGLMTPQAFAKKKQSDDGYETQTQSLSAGFPKQGEFGLGLMIGTFFAATGKYWLSNQAAIDFGMGFVGYPWFVTYADYLWHMPRVFGTRSQFGRESSLYFGGGGGVGFWSSTDACGHWACGWDNHESGSAVFIRGLAGVEWYPAPTRFGVFGELGPSILVAPHTWGTVDVNIGGRYYF
jgi:hypothetical protein